MSIIKTDSLTKIYNPETVPVYALNQVNISVEKGEFTSVVGPSGSGKTTLLNMIGGLDKPTQGTVFINGEDITAMTDYERTEFRLHNIGFVFQAYNLIPVFTALENVNFIMQLQGQPAGESRQRSLELLRQVGLEDRADARPSEMSGGQQQRVAVARALASRPGFILADEPTANLDSTAAMNLLDIMQSMNEEHQVTFIFSTHDQRVIERARRVITMVDGRIDDDQVRS